MTAIAPYRLDIHIGTTEDGKRVTATPQFWDYFARSLFDRVGGIDAPTNNELVIDMHDDAGLEEFKHEFGKLFDGLNQTPPQQPAQPEPAPSGRLEALEALVHSLQAEIEGLKQGFQL